MTSETEWRNALEAMMFESEAGKRDPTPLANLLRSGEPVPALVATTIGALLDNKRGLQNWGLRLELKDAGPARAKTISDQAIVEARIHLADSAVERGEKKEAVVHELKKHGISRATAMRQMKRVAHKNDSESQIPDKN